MGVTVPLEKQSRQQQQDGRSWTGRFVLVRACDDVRDSGIDEALRILLAGEVCPTTAIRWNVPYPVLLRSLGAGVI